MALHSYGIVTLEKIKMSQENLDRWNKILADATAVVDAVQYARTCGLEVEFMMTFLEHHELGRYSVAECIAHSLREWDL